MADDGKSPSHRPVPPARDKAKAPADRPFDKWLQKQLHAMYDEIASEPLPDDLLNLIDHDAENNSKKGEPPKSSGST